MEELANLEWERGILEYLSERGKGAGEIKSIVLKTGGKAGTGRVVSNEIVGKF